MLNSISAIIASAVILFSGQPAERSQVLARASYSLSNRYGNSYVNEVFADNILLTLAYMDGKVKSGQNFSWSEIKASGSSMILLKPGQTFAFHDSVLSRYKNSVVATTNAHFTSNEGFRSDGWLVGDGVCHLASFMYALTKEAGLKAEAPTNHDFANIPDVPKELGVSIYYTPENSTSSTLQNLYITNSFNKTIAFVFEHNNNNLDIRVEQLN
ncbi:hypothetical protein GYA28_00015 [Candidatus Roizmanbacteria bacterium]|nr:hypothetical protein [Candidatus Roizmanbacteria bacterium]